MSAAAPGAGPRRPPYERTAPVLSFTVHGDPKPQGSKSGFVNPKTGKVNMVESSKYLKPWRGTVTRAIKDAIRAAAPAAGGFPLLGPVAVELVFTMPKPKSAPKTRVTWPIVYPDVDKLTRAILDAGKYGGAWKDDSQIVDVHATKVYPLEAPGALRQPGVTATVYLIGQQPTADPGVQAALFQEITQ